MAGLDDLRTQLSSSLRALPALAVGLWLAASGCARAPERDEHPGAQAPSTPAAPVGDSLLPMDEMLRRFRAGLAPAAELAGGGRSREELIARLVEAIEQADTAAIERLQISKAEYAWVYFPTSAYAAPPYEMPPDVAWMLSQAASDKGRTRLLQRLGGTRLRYRGYTCADSATEGANRFWRACSVDYVDPGEGRVQRRLFGTIIGHAGSYKFLTYTNDF